MEIKFYTDKGVIDLSNVKFSTQEENSMMSQKTLTPFFFPFEIYLDDVFLNTFGDYSSFESKNLETNIPGLLFFEDQTYKAKLEIQTTEGNKLIGQIDFGLEEIPNFEKKLNELPLDSFKVDNIYTHAESIITKQWPSVNYNFPRIFTKKYDQNSNMWNAFDGYYNDSVIDNGLCKFKQNYIAGNGDINNLNIVHPCPHPIYLLKVGFADAGYDLIGDILIDPDLQQRWLFSGTEYFTMKSQTKVGVTASPLDYNTDDPFSYYINGHVIRLRKRTYNKSIGSLPKGNYNIVGAFDFKTFNNSTVELKISVNGVDVYAFKEFFDGGIIRTINLNFSSYFNRDADNVITFYADYVPINPDGSEYNIISFELISDVLTENNSGSEETKVVINANEINLARAVPNITFGDYVNGVKNWFNYDLEVLGAKVIMNKLGDREPDVIQDFQSFEVKEPKRNHLKKKSFLIKFPELDNYSLDSMYYDDKGSKINGSKNKDTNEIEIPGYPLPVLKPKENSVPTAIVKKDADDLIGLVYYDGLVAGQNNSKNIPGCAHPELFDKNFKKWLRQRVRGTEYNWTKIMNAESFVGMNIKKHIFCYNNIHLIVRLNKDKVGDNTYEVEFVTETIN
ncbi:hypothetical protein [Chryseobacterium oncorhynchi]|uniref:Uncharacterized protein n=1 Tax=Chryseobacterium oncorhynchi TaxID=741074 RepID=A0A316X4A1_9FLAO|nr:hypothetical protein [Chryseobacterium oncorhynchi]PWN67586.1 hypothetical protein C1638_003070 [Chryseobacterium oncorhynchi]